MKSAPSFSAVVAAFLVLATTCHASDTSAPGTLREAPPAVRTVPDTDLPGTDLLEVDTLALDIDSELEPPEPTALDDAPLRRESHWLTDPPHPDRHNLWVPTVEWATAMSLTIPIFMIDPAFVNTGTISADNFVDAWTNPPVWDTDGIIANYILHPIMGAEAYLTVRNRDYGPITSFLFSTGVSFAWEYLFEAWVEHPSAQDLLTTSPIGSIQGELRFLLRRRVAQWKPSKGRDALLVAIDPIEAIHRYIGKKCLDRSDEATAGTVGSSVDFGPDRASMWLTMRF